MVIDFGKCEVWSDEEWEMGQGGHAPKLMAGVGQL